jgi:hypothetical protein
MKKLAIILIFVICAATLLPDISVMAQPAYTPCENPATATSTLDAYSFLTNYADILSLISAADYKNATMLLDRLKYVSIPADLQYITDRYSNLTQQLINVLNNLENQLDEASALLNQYRLNEASQILRSAGILVAQAEILMSNLQDATVALSQSLGVFAVPAQSRVTEAYNQLQSMIQRLNELISRYKALLSSINDNAQVIKGERLKPTELSLNLNAAVVFVGGYVSASGILTSNGQALSGRPIALLLEGKQVAAATTGSDGSYSAIVSIPYEYVDNMIVEALYTPAGNDVGVYLASVSPVLTVDVTFYETKLETTVPDQAYPGLSITVNGNVTSEDGLPLSQRTVILLFDGGLLAEAETGSDGLFGIQATLSSQTQTGAHSLNVTVEPLGTYAGTSHESTLNIVKMASKIDVKVPSLVVLPAGIYVEGNASSASGAVGQAAVTIEIASTAVDAKTAANGEFNATLKMPLNLVFVGFQELDVKIEPAEPWQASSQTQVSVFIVNPVNLGLASSVFIVVGAVLSTRWGKSKPKREEKSSETPAFVPQPENVAKAAVLAKSEFMFEGVKGKVLEAYVKAMRAVESVNEISLKPHMTLREFLYDAQPKIGDAVNPFANLTVLAERALYSPHQPRIEEVAKAEDLATKVETVLKHGDA